MSQAGERVTEQVSTQAGTQVSTQAKRILNYCRIPHSREEILKFLELKPHYKSFKRHVIPLLEDELVEMTIPDKHKSQNQQYRTTQKGLELLK